MGNPVIRHKRYACNYNNKKNRMKMDREKKLQKSPMQFRTLFKKFHNSVLMCICKVITRKVGKFLLAKTRLRIGDFWGGLSRETM